MAPGQQHEVRRKPRLQGTQESLALLRAASWLSELEKLVNSLGLSLLIRKM